MSMKRLDLSLHELQAEKPPKDIYTAIRFRYSMNGTEIKRDDFEGMMIQGRRLTPFYLVEATMPVDDADVKSSSDLTGLHFLRLTSPLPRDHDQTSSVGQEVVHPNSEAV
jgi:hypothetical protein